MKEPAQPLFLERQSYRRRRLTDAARVLPLFGLFLFLLPLLWPATVPAETPLVAQKGLYIFGVWILLVFAAAAIAARLRPEDEQTPETQAPEDT